MGRPRKISELTQITGAMDAEGKAIVSEMPENPRPIPPGVGPRTTIEPPKRKKVADNLDPTREKRGADEAVVPDLPIKNNDAVPSKPKSPLGRSTLSGIMQAHGHVETFQPTTLSQILGNRGMQKYGTLDENEYVQSLASMNKADLQAHATQVGLVPIDDRERMSKRLIHEFKLHVASFQRPQARRSAPQVMSPEVAKILAAGR